LLTPLSHAFLFFSLKEQPRPNYAWLNCTFQGGMKTRS
jgi:hypothetical protein